MRNANLPMRNRCRFVGECRSRQHIPAAIPRDDVSQAFSAGVWAVDRSLPKHSHDVDASSDRCVLHCSGRNDQRSSRKGEAVVRRNSERKMPGCVGSSGFRIDAARGEEDSIAGVVGEGTSSACEFRVAILLDVRRCSRCSPRVHRCSCKSLWLPSPPTCWRRRAGDEGAGPYTAIKSFVFLCRKPPHPQPLSPRFVVKQDLSTNLGERGAFSSMCRLQCPLEEHGENL